jgi:hypothetical protein
MGISLKMHKMLWGRAANRCAFPDCRRELVMDASQPDDESLIGDACHIVAQSPTGPRGDSPLTPEQRDKYDNLILLCKVHHKLVDDQPNTYTVQRLLEMKAAHEKWVRESLQEFDAAKQHDDELYAGYVEEWVRRADLDNWLAWTSGILYARPLMPITRDKELTGLRNWLFSRIWPKRYPELEAAFKNFLHVLQDFHDTFRAHATKRIDTEALWIDRLYQIDRCPELGPDYTQGEAPWLNRLHQIDEGDLSRVNRVRRELEFYTDLIQDLMLELTRAANYICDRVRQFIDPTFRLHEGLIPVEFGPFLILPTGWLTGRLRHNPEYRGKERVLHPYPGLEKFKKDRTKRDIYHVHVKLAGERPSLSWD